MLKQEAVYWEPDGVDQFAQERFLLPVDIKCRWEDELEQGIDETGNETIFVSTVYVDRDVRVGGRIMKGTVNDLEGPAPPQESHRVRRFDLIPTLDARQFLRTIKL
jgi:hypothetical protein